MHQQSPRKPGFSCDGKVVISPQVPRSSKLYVWTMTEIYATQVIIASSSSAEVSVVLDL